jgi:Tol biopolymer transport system component
MCIVCWAFASLATLGNAGAGGVGDKAAPGGEQPSHATDYSREHGPPAAALPAPLGPTDPGLLLPGEERYLKHVRQLTFGQPAGTPAEAGPANYAEAYWSPDGTRLTLQTTRGGAGCDQIYTLDLLTGALQPVSSGEGRCTCSYFTPDGTRLIYSSTFESVGPGCPPKADMSKGYVWPVYDYGIYVADAATGQVEARLTPTDSYNAEGTIDWNSRWLYFTSTRDGDLDIYRMRLSREGADEVERLTDEPGYDGGPFISYDGRTVVYRRDAAETPAELAEYQALLADGLVKPSKLELWAMDADGTHKRQLTANGAANFAPFLHPDGRTLIYCSNVADTQQHRRFELWAMPLDGSRPARQVTAGGEFDGFPMFSPDGKYLVWCSNRNHAQAHETNVFIAEWNGIDWDNE